MKKSSLSLSLSLIKPLRFVLHLLPTTCSKFHSFVLAKWVAMQQLF
ncbi:hypothetical protein GLYMA_01G209666v4 [Glycine max]|nr:hypothetical protein GLYMA_01G209666v4 [Glycine max]KAH1164149.1 hypothetical protein GYH30_002270 [Glycine max]